MAETTAKKTAAKKAAPAKVESATDKAVKALEAAFEQAKKAGIAVRGTYSFTDKTGTKTARLGQN